MSAKLIVLLILSCSFVFIVSENVTTIFQLEASDANKDLKYYGTWRVVTRNGARGFPLRRGNMQISNVWAGEPCCETWSHDGWTKLSQKEALCYNPPLEADNIKPADSTSAAPAREYKQDSEGVWRGAMDLDSRARLTFVPPESGRAALAIYLCKFKETRDDQCLSVVMTGSSANGKTLRYRTKRPSSFEDNSLGARSKAATFNHRKTYIVREAYDVQEGWQTNYSYHFRIERTDQGDLELVLDDGHPSQRRQITLRGHFPHNKIAVTTLMSGASDAVRKLQLTADSAWQGHLSPGESINISFSPNSNDIGHLGLALCKDRFREHCSATVIDGMAHGKLVRNEPAYWTAGFEDADKLIPDTSKNARWGKSTFKFTLSRGNDGTVTITADGDENKYTWSVPDNYNLLLVDTYHGEGTAKVNRESKDNTAFIWRLDREVGELRSPPIPDWYVDGDVCVSVAARVSQDADIVVSVQRFGGNKGSRVLETLKSNAGSEWIQKRITIPPSRLLQKHKVQIVLTARQFLQTEYPVLVQWAAGCKPGGPDDDVFFKGFFTPTFNGTVGFRSSQRSVENTTIFGYDFFPRPNEVCQNDGLLNLDAKCLCRPGFTGRLCEKACGPNRFGEECESKCSTSFSPRECHGMWLCTPDLPCDCAPGFQGLLCDQPCEGGKYGVGCRQECGQCAYGTTCDPYSGVCRTGCSGSRLPPFCKTECGRSGLVVPLIGGGNVATHNQYPWHVGVYDGKYTSSDLNVTKIEHICSGTIITPFRVISAAHCFWDGRTGRPTSADRYAVAFAKLKRGWYATEEKPNEIQRRDIAFIHIPPGFQGILNSKEDDIAVLEMTTPVDRTPYVLPVCFDQVGGYEEILRERSVGNIAGWGLNENNTPSEDLKETRLAFIPRDECLKAVAVESFQPYVTANDRFCAGDHEGTNYVGPGDTGGGLVFPQSGNYFLRGVVSTGQRDKTFAVYTNVSYHRNWIVDKLQNAALRDAYTTILLLR